MGWFTDLLGKVSPEAALRRANATRALEATQARSFDGASKGRRLKNWRTTGASANAEHSAAASTLRNRSRDLVRNDGYAKRAVEIMGECSIGGGIIPKPATGSDALDRAIREAFEEWSQECDAEQQADFYGMQDLAVQTIVESGDVLIRRRSRRASDGLEIPMQLQLMEPDHLDTTHLKNNSTGNDIIHGIEVDPLNRRQTYWLYPTHPGEVGLMRSMRSTSTPVPADQVAHAYRKTRPGQLIGIPWLSAAMLDLRDLGDYEQAEAVRKKIEACLSVFVTSNDPANPPLLGEESEDDDGRLETLEPGMIEYLEAGEDIKTVSPSPGSGYDAYTRARLHKIATAVGMPYMLLTGDVSRANWSSYKAGIVPFKQMVRRFQKRAIIPMVCRPTWRWFINSAFAAGKIGEIDYGVEWTLPGFEPIDRLKEAMADQMEARIGKTPMQAQIRAGGGDPEQVLAAFKEWASLTDAAQLVFDSDPRKVSNAGLTQARPPGSVLPGEETDDKPTE